MNGVELVLFPKCFEGEEPPSASDAWDAMEKRREAAASPSSQDLLSQRQQMTAGQVPADEGAPEAPAQEETPAPRQFQAPSADQVAAEAPPENLMISPEPVQAPQAPTPQQPDEPPGNEANHGQIRRYYTKKLSVVEQERDEYKRMLEQNPPAVAVEAVMEDESFKSEFVRPVETSRENVRQQIIGLGFGEETADNVTGMKPAEQMNWIEENGMGLGDAIKPALADLAAKTLAMEQAVQKQAANVDELKEAHRRREAELASERKQQTVETTLTALDNLANSGFRFFVRQQGNTPESEAWNEQVDSLSSYAFKVATEGTQEQMLEYMAKGLVADQLVGQVDKLSQQNAELAQRLGIQAQVQPRSGSGQTAQPGSLSGEPISAGEAWDRMVARRSGISA